MINYKNGRIPIDKVIEVIKDYMEVADTALDSYSFRTLPSNMLETAEKFEAIGFAWGDEKPHEDLDIAKCDDGWVVKWVLGSKIVRRHNFSRNETTERRVWFKYAYPDDWEWVKYVLSRYHPIKIDEYDHFIFDIENGKKLIKDYQAIGDEIRKRWKIREKESRVKELYKELADIENEVFVERRDIV